MQYIYAGTSEAIQNRKKEKYTLSNYNFHYKQNIKLQSLSKLTDKGEIGNGSNHWSQVCTKTLKRRNNGTGMNIIFKLSTTQSNRRFLPLKCMHTLCGNEFQDMTFFGVPFGSVRFMFGEAFVWKCVRGECMPAYM